MPMKCYFLHLPGDHLWFGPRIRLDQIFCMIVKTQKVDLYKGASGVRKFTKQEMQVPYMRHVLGN